MSKAVKEKAPSLSTEDLQRTSAELVQNALALHSDLPSVQLAAKIDALAQREFLKELDASLRVAHWLRLVRAERAKRTREKRDAAWTFPGIRDLALSLPLRVPIGDGKTVRRDQLRFEHTNLYLKVLSAQSREQAEKRKSAVLEIQKLWPRAERRPRQMTLAELDSFKSAGNGDQE
jgi:hypothetical protein